MKKFTYMLAVSIGLLFGWNMAAMSATFEPGCSINGHGWVMTPEANCLTAEFETFSATIVEPSGADDRPFDVIVQLFGPALPKTWETGWIHGAGADGCKADVWRKPQSANQNAGAVLITSMRMCDYTADKQIIVPEPSPVPLPASGAALVLGIGALAWARRRR